MRRLVPALAATAVMLAACGSATPAATSDAPQTAAASTGSPSAPGTTTVDGVITITSSDLALPDPIPATLPDDAPRRIVSLATGVGETLAALGVADRVVGRDETSDVPQVSDAPIVTKAHAVSAEKVLALAPDLVLVDAATSPPEALAQIADAGITVVTVPEAWTLTDIAARTRAVATAVGATPEAADRVIAEATGPTATSTPADPPRVAFLYLRGTSAVYLVGGSGSGADSLISAAGGVDAGASAGYSAFVPLTAEAVAALDPDILLVMTQGLASVGGIDGLVALPGVAQTRAGQDRRVIAVDDTLLLSFGPRTGALVDALRTAMATSAA